jgi:hypothetical protein
MIGALVGVYSIPSEMLEKLLKFDCTKSGIIRPEFLSVRMNALKNIKLLIASRPLNKF